MFLNILQEKFVKDLRKSKNRICGHEKYKLEQEIQIMNQIKIEKGIGG